MSKQTINIGASPNDGTGTPLRTSFDYTNQNFTELYTAVGPSGNNIVVPGNATITGDLTVRTNKLKVDATGVAIGATSATYLFDVRGTDTTVGLIAGLTKGIRFVAGASTVKIEGVDNTGAASYQPLSIGGSALDFSLSGTTAMTLNSTGLGIGVSPTYKIDVSSSSNIVGRISSSSVLNTGFNIANTTGSSWSLYSFGSNDATLQNSFGIYHQSGASFLQITQTGNVGIGVTPSAWGSNYKALQIGAQSCFYNALGYITSINTNAFENSSGQLVRIANGEATRYVQSGGVHLWYYAANAIVGTVGGFTQAMTLDASGNLLVGVTSAGGNRLNVQTASGDCTTLIKSQAANVNSAIDYVTNYGNHTIRKSGTAVWDFGVINDASATPAFKVSNASSIGVQLVSAATSWTTLSDETVKDIIEPISNAVAKVGSLRSVIGKFKTDDSSKRRSFLIAQDVQSVLPEAVDVIGENNELGLRYTEVIPLLVAAIKELTSRVQTLEAR